MGAVEIVPDPTRAPDTLFLSPAVLALVIAGVALSVLGMSLVGVLADRRLANRTHKFEEIIVQLSCAQQQVEASQKELQEQKFRLDTAINNMGAGLCMFDEETQLVVCNDRYAEMYRLPPELLKPGTPRREIIKHRVTNGILKDEAVDSAAKPVAPTFAVPPGDATSGRIDEFADGRSIRVTLHPMPSGGWVETHLDISDSRRLERLKDEFVSTVNHELRTPLTSISGSLALLASGTAGQLPDRASHLVGIAHRNSQRLARLINDILDVEKMESGQMVFHLTRVEVRSVVEQAIEANRSVAESMGVDVRLVAGSDAADVCADPDRLFQVVTNLLSNAVKFSPRAGEVEVAVEAQMERVRVSVRDHGPGLPLEFRSRIFERFAQAETVDFRHRGGSGLGLNIVKQIVTRLGGEVGFDDAPGGGTSFHVVLPRLAPVRGAERGAPADGAPSLADEDDGDTVTPLGDRLRRVAARDELAAGVGEGAGAAHHESHSLAVEAPFAANNRWHS
jgi:signal transduction histidine kinase